ncbi:hypothetical protein FACS1894186_6470 [Alphaproteobacteria bacterium]|nr:hypothetical protein FACS1894186_6470 [Alphaproteobacteria bacterium]
MPRRPVPKSKPLLMLAATLLSACTRTGVYDGAPPCPVWPTGGAAVAENLRRIPYATYEAFWEHQSRLRKLRQELAACEAAAP